MTLTLLLTTRAGYLVFQYGAVVLNSLSIWEILSTPVFLLTKRLQIRVNVLSGTNSFLKPGPKERRGIVRQNIDSILYGLIFVK